MANLLPISEINAVDLDVMEFTEDTSLTYAIDNDTLKIAGKNDRLDAMVQAIHLLLNTQVDKYIIYSMERKYGWDYEDLIGMPATYCVPEIERRVTEALLLDTRITDVGNFEFEVNKNTIHVTFQVGTIFGKAEVETDVSI